MLGGYCQPLQAEETERFFDRYNYHFLTETEGLPHSYVEKIVSDSDGYLWLATHQGIARYDGYQLLSFDTCSTSLASGFHLKSSFAAALCPDRYGRLWIGGERGIDLFHLKHFMADSLLLSAKHPVAAMLRQPVTALYSDYKGRMWVAAAHSLWCLAFDAEGKLVDYHTLDVPAQSDIKAMAEYACGTESPRLYVGLDNELCLVSPTSGHRLAVEPLTSQIPSFSEDWRIHCIQPDADYLWIGTNRGLFRYSHSRKQLSRYRYSTHRRGMLSQAYITDIKLTARGHLIVATFNGLNVYDRTSDSFSFIRQAETPGNSSINSSAITSLYTLGETIFAGTQTGGLNILSPKRLQVRFLTDKPLNGLAEEPDGTLWMSVVEQGIIGWNPAVPGQRSHYCFVPNNPQTLSNNTLGGLLLDSRHRLWAYTWGVGINCIDLNTPHTTRVQRYTRENNPTLKGDFINSAVEDSLNHGIWFGSTRGLQFLDLHTNLFTRITFGETGNEFERISALFIDNRRRLWVGTSQGLFILALGTFNASSNQVDYLHLPYKLDQPSSRHPERINCILQDGDGNLWLGGDGTGLYRVREKGTSVGHETLKADRFTFDNITTTQGLPSNTILALETKGADELWVLTTDGLSSIYLPSLHINSYTQADGLPAIQLYGGGLHYSPVHQALLACTSNGLLFIRQRKEHMTSVQTLVHISSVTTEGGSVLYPTDCPDSPFTTTSLTLHESEGPLTISLSSSNYDHANVRYAYRISEFEEPVILPLGQHTIYLDGLKAGEHQLEVCVTDGSGNWSKQVTRLDIHLLPYAYRMPWFYLAILLVVAGAVLLYLYWRSQRRKAVRRSIQQAVEEAIRQTVIKLQNQQAAERQATERQAVARIQEGSQTAQTAEATQIQESVQFQEATQTAEANRQEDVGQEGVAEDKVAQEEKEPDKDKAAQDEVASSRDTLFMNQAVELMKRNFAECDYTLDSFVHDMGYSKTFVNKKMQQLTGQPIGQFMKNYRLHVAQQMIEQGSADLTVSEIAYAVGFNDPKYFTKCFKEVIGYLPSSKLKR